MKSYFEDSIPFIKPQDVRVMVDGPDLWTDVESLKRCQWSVTSSKFWNPEFAWELKMFWPKDWKPGMLSGYWYNGSSCLMIMDDYGDLVLPEPDEDGVLAVNTPPSALSDVPGIHEAIFAQDYGHCIILDTDEDGCVLLKVLNDTGEPSENITNGWGNLIPGTWEVPRLTPKDIQESGWDILHSHASLDGMLCVRWLGLYGTAPYEENNKLFGFNSEPDQFLWGDEKNYTRKIARKLFQFETQPHRELAAECFPMEMGSLLARYKYFQEDRSMMLGLVIDQAQSELRRIYAQDCYSYYNEQTGELEVERSYLKHWEGWTSARTAYESVFVEKRLRRTYTEGFVRNSSPCAMVVYGDPNCLDKQYQHLIKKFKKNGFPIYWLQPATEI